MPSSHSNSPLIDPLVEAPPPVAPVEKAAKSTYGQILKSTALVGGSSALNIGIGIIRSKAMALLLGPAGFGLFGIYGSIANLTQSIAGMGINSSGVRQIAEAVGSGNIDRIALVAAVLRRTSIVVGALGALFLAVFCKQLSILTFGNDKHISGILLLSFAVLFNLVSAGQSAMIQGLRRIPDLAKINVLGAFLGTLVTIPVVYVLRDHGVAPSLVAIGAMTLATSWWYSRKVRIHRPALAPLQVKQEAAKLFKLGFAFMTSSMCMMGSAYFVRITVLHKLGFEATGLYQAAWTLGVLYVGFVLQAMGADFYPRLTACANDNVKCNRLVNEQARVSLLLAGPGVLATLAFAPMVIALFYSAKFGGAVGLLKWISLGATLQVISWPMGFIIMAKGSQNIFFWSELAWTVVHLGLAWICVSYFGLNGAGIAFFGSYVFHAIMIYAVVRWHSGFRWSTDNKRTGALFVSSIAAVFCGYYVLPLIWAECAGVLAAVLTSVYSIRVLLTLVSSDRLPRHIRRVLVLFKTAPAAASLD
jgi:antigen flippase